jgi:hypothetical protein
VVLAHITVRQKTKSLCLYAGCYMSGSAPPPHPPLLRHPRGKQLWPPSGIGRTGNSRSEIRTTWGTGMNFGVVLLRGMTLPFASLSHVATFLPVDRPGLRGVSRHQPLRQSHACSRRPVGYTASSWPSMKRVFRHFSRKHFYLFLGFYVVFAGFTFFVLSRRSESDWRYNLSMAATAGFRR